MNILNLSKYAILTLIIFLYIIGEGIAGYNINQLIFPTPVFQKKTQGEFIIKPNTKIVYDEASISNALLLKEELKEGLGLILKLNKDVEETKEQSSIILSIKNIYNKTFGKDLRMGQRESYSLSIAEDYISLSGTDLAGQLYGLLTLLQLIDLNSGAVQNIQIWDWPRMSFRGLRGHFPKDTPQEIENFKRIIKTMAFCRLNQLWVRDLYVRRFPASLKLESYPEICGEDALPKTIAKELISFSNKWGTEVIGSIAATADNVWSIYPHLIEMEEQESPFTVKIKNEVNRTPRYRFGARFNFCPSQEETYKLLFNLIDEMAPLFSSKVFDLGIDEVDQYYNGSRWVACNFCKGKDPVKLFSEYVNRLADYVISKDKIPLVNSNPFIKEHGGEFKEIYKAVSLLRKDIIINNWSEGHVRARKGMEGYYQKFSSTDYFKKFGFKKVVHLVGNGQRWQGRPELLESKGMLDCYGAFVTHYQYITDGTFANSESIDDIAFSGNHFWFPNVPEMGSNLEKTQILYSKKVIQGILEGKPIIKAATDGRNLILGTR